MSRILSLIVVLIAFCTVSSFAQETGSAALTSHSSFTIAASMPSGDYKKSNSVGLFLSYDRAKYFTDVVGLGFSLGLGVNPLIDENEIYTHNEPTAYGRAMIGPEFTLPLGNFAPEVRLLGGLASARTGEVQYDNILGSTTVQSDMAFAFGYTVGGGIRYSGGKSNSGIRLGVEYQSATYKFNNTVVTEVGGSTVLSEDIESKVKMNPLHIYLSFSFFLDK